jgi:hypothetical protein
MLNTLANHGFLPRAGKNITKEMYEIQNPDLVVPTLLLTRGGILSTLKVVFEFKIPIQKDDELNKSSGFIGSTMHRSMRFTCRLNWRPRQQKR